MTKTKTRPRSASPEALRAVQSAAEAAAAASMPTAPPEPTPEQMQKAIEDARADQNRRGQECSQEIQAVLAKHRCTITSVMERPQVVGQLVAGMPACIQMTAGWRLIAQP